jgi:RND family efflux transporter MFP subunit
MKRMGLSPRVIVVAALAAGLLAAAGCKSSGTQGTASAETAGAAPVKVMKAVRQTISEKISYTGTLEAWRAINITPEIGGKIARILVDEGQTVAEGQLLAELETESARLQLKQAEAGLAVARANLEDAKRNKERMDRLIRENAISEMQREKVQLGYEAASAQLDQAQAALNLARHALDVSIMKAPFAGVIASRNAEVGDVINPMMGSFSTASGVLSLVDFSRVKITVEAGQDDMARIKKGQPASLKVAYAPGREFSGAVTVVNLAADPATKKFGVEVQVSNPGLVLRPGTFGDVFFEVSSHANAIVVPQRAILENAYVFVVSDGKAYRREVTTGLQNTTLVEILSGLRDGDRVITDGNFGLEDGSPVTVEEGGRP